MFKRAIAALGLFAAATGLADRRTRRRARAETPPPASAPVAIPAQRAATAAESLSTGSVAGVPARR